MAARFQARERQLVMTALLRRLFASEDGQDLIEYALLSALIAIVGFLALANLGEAIRVVYTGWDTAVQNVSSCTPAPGGGC